MNIYVNMYVQITNWEKLIIAIEKSSSVATDNISIENIFSF